MTMFLPTTTAGSLPKPSWLAQPGTLWSPWRLEGADLTAGKQDALRLALDDQRQAGIHILGDGEQTRQHFVKTFIEHLAGVDFEKRETVRIRNRYDASVPTVIGAVSRPGPVFVDDARFLRAQTDQPIKWTLPGPMTMIDTLYDAHYRSREKLAWNLPASSTRKPVSWTQPGSTSSSSTSLPSTCSSTRPTTGASPRWSARQRG